MKFDTIDLWIIIKHTQLVKPDSDSVQIYLFRCLYISCEMRDSFKSALKTVGLILSFHLQKVKIKIACLFHGYIITLAWMVLMVPENCSFFAWQFHHEFQVIRECDALYKMLHTTCRDTINGKASHDKSTSSLEKYIFMYFWP